MTSADLQPTLYRRVPTWLHRLSDAKVILVRAGGEPKEIRGIAVGIWMVLDEASTLEQIRHELADFAPDINPADLDDALALMCEHGLIELTPQPS